MAEPDDAWPGRTRTPRTSRRSLALSSRGSASGRTATEAFALLRHRFVLLRHRYVKALAALRIGHPPIRPASGLAASDVTGPVTVHGGMMLDDAGTWARLVATRMPASDDAPPVLTCTLTLYAADGNVVSSATAIRRRS